MQCQSQAILCQPCDNRAMPHFAVCAECHEIILAIVPLSLRDTIVSGIAVPIEALRIAVAESESES